MIEKFNPSKKNALLELLDYLQNNKDYDFYYTKDNTRIYITDMTSLKGLLRECSNVYIYSERDDYKGVIMVWKSMGGDTHRYNVKINAQSARIAQDLLTILTWNFNKELFIKIFANVKT